MEKTGKDDKIIDKINTSVMPVLRFSYYKEFKNGIKGSIIITNYTSAEAQIFLINSDERSEGNEKANINSILPKEEKLFSAYKEDCISKNDNNLLFGLDVYKQYGVTPLVGAYLTAHIVDFVCHIINTNPNRNYRGSYQTDRSVEVYARAKWRYELYQIEDELNYYLSEEASWRRSIIEQALAPYEIQDLYRKWIDVGYADIKNSYVSQLRSEDKCITLYYAMHYIVESDKKSLPWWLLLEQVLSHKDKAYRIRYYKLGIQEVLAYYALIKYIYKNKPDSYEIGLDEITLRERLDLFEWYVDRCIGEFYTDLTTKDDPLRSTYPTREEARELAVAQIKKNLGKYPHWLSDEQKDLYAKYEQAFCVNQHLEFSILSAIGLNAPAKLFSESVQKVIAGQVERVKPKDPQPEKATSTTNKPDISFASIIVNNKEKTLKELHKLIDGHKGKDIGVVLAAATYKYHVLLRTPTEVEFRQEFPNIQKCSWRSISAWLKKVNRYEDLPYDVQEIELDL